MAATAAASAIISKVADNNHASGVFLVSASPHPIVSNTAAIMSDAVPKTRELRSFDEICAEFQFSDLRPHACLGRESYAGL